MFCKNCVMQIPDNSEFCPLCGGNQNAEIPPHCLMPGTILHEKYIVGGVIGEGGFGITYIGRDTVLDMKVAVKEYFPNGFVNRTASVSSELIASKNLNRKEFFEKGKASFLSEARVLAKFASEPGIVSVRDFFEENNTAYIVMEFLEGKTLKSYLKENGTMSPKEAFELLKPVISSLDKVHGKGMIHRDISPDNIMVCGNIVKLLDFGAARDIDNKMSTAIVVKQGYAPEEQYGSKINQGSWTDVYAICATMYECITGKIPPVSVNRVINDTIKTPSQYGIAVSPAFESVLMKGLSVMRANRYQTMSQLLKDFEAALSNDSFVPAQAANNGNATMVIDNSQTETLTSGNVTTQVTAQQPVFATENMTSYDSSSTEVVDNDINTASFMNNKTEAVVNNTSVKTEAVTNNMSVKTEAVPNSTFVKTEAMPNNTVVKTEAVPNNTAVNAPVMQAEKPPKKPIPIVLPIIGAVLLIVVAAVIMFTASGVKICGKKYSKSEDYLTLNDKTITADDMTAIGKLKDLNNLTFRNCTFDGVAGACFNQLPEQITTLYIEGCTGITSYSDISRLSELRYFELENDAITQEQFSSIDFSNLTNMYSLSLNGDKAISDISSISAMGNNLTVLNINELSVNDISMLGQFTNLNVLRAESCGISKITSLAELSNLQKLDLSNNEISDISSLSKLNNIKYLELDSNNISDLTGIETMIYLEGVDLSNNKLKSLDGLSNSVLLKKVYADYNNLSDISVLSKCADSLEYVSVCSNYNITNLQSLQSAANLKYLAFDYNKVESLIPLTNCKQITSLFGSHNQIKSMNGIEQMDKLEYLGLSDNLFTDTSYLDNLLDTYDPYNFSDERSGEYKFIDLSHNRISSIGKISEGVKIDYLSVYDNPIDSCGWASNTKGSHIVITYNEKMSLSQLKGIFSYYDIVDCPLDTQIATSVDLTGSQTSSFVTFNSKGEIDVQIGETYEKSISNQRSRVI